MFGLSAGLAIPSTAGNVHVTYQLPSRPLVEHEFVFQPSTPAKTVTVAGTFNHWDKTAEPLLPDGKVWRATVNLPAGEVHYKFVIDGATWIDDPSMPSTAVDKDGNTVLSLTPVSYTRPARLNDGIVTESSLLHPTCAPYLNYDRGRLTLTLRARKDDLALVGLLLNGRRHPMSITSTDDLYAFFSVEIPWNRKADLTYVFDIDDGVCRAQFGSNGLTTKAKPFVLSAAEFKPFETPSWPEQSVMYQIFPDRFANGDPSNDPPGVQPWDAKPTPFNHFGGDIQGIHNHLSYLSNLGITAVYYTPIFKSQSNHRYDVADYKVIEPEIGTNQSFVKLTNDMSARGIRTVMDFVFNHSSASFAPFEDVVAKGESSQYRNWFFVHSYPVHAGDPPNYETYNGWWGMPKLNEANPATRRYMVDIAGYWQKRIPLAGLRFDVADLLPPDFWRAMRARVKANDPDAWMVGETWGDASSWLTGDQWDAAMNYPFMNANVDFFADAKITPSTYAARLMELYRAYPPQVSRGMMNSLSTHDTPRFLTRCHNNTDLDLLAAAVQLTWAGMPCIYYGEELGMQGGADPDNRRPMAWTSATPDNRFLSYYKKLIRIRKSSRALQSGTPAILMVDDATQTLAYSRTLGNDVAIVAVNRSAKVRTVSIPLPSNARLGFVDALFGRPVVRAKGTLRIELAPISAAILLPTTPTHR